MFNSFLKFVQFKMKYLYENSLFLQNIDKFILPFILLTYISSTFMGSDSIGFFALVAIFLTFVKILIKPDEKIDLNHFEIWILAYFMIVIISLCGSTLFALSLKGFFKTFLYIGFYFSLVQYLKSNNKNIPLLLGVIGCCVCAESIIGAIQSTLHLEQISTWQDTSNINPEDVISRVYGTLKPLNPNLFGGYLVAGLPVVLGSIFYFVNKRKTLFSVAGCILSIIVMYVILQTGCRGAYISMMLVLFALFILSAKFLWAKYKKIYYAIISFGIAFFTFIMITVSSLRNRFLSIFAMRADSSNSFRFNVYHSSFEMFRDNWLLGIGVGNKNFREIYGLYMKTGFDALSAYNIYLETAVESGIFALIAFLGFLIVLSVDSVKMMWSKIDTEAAIYIGICITSIWAVMFHGLVDTIYFRPQLQFLFWTCVAVISASLHNYHTTRKN